ncbi:PDZ and LIM domain protein 7 isoform X2 [Erpetoichthys calabaricus]|uniref:PDZ and LIM domain protein 7 isoform X2 n=1 Tax=Erpetoichthys calabaricus TaxID=27687 RepID=UPI002234803B|nr:PDZ and LIM domain protein 7 isoform X2 [Erpetoichthys calabaricus]
MFVTACPVKPLWSQQINRNNMDLYSVTLEGPAPWGFRLQGGKDFNMPLTVSRLTPGGKAAQQNVGVGDWVVSIDGVNAEGLTHVEAQNKIKACTDRLSLTLSRAFHPTAASKKDMHAAVAPQPKYSFESSMSLNKMARPFGEVSSSPGSLTKPVSSAPKFNPVSKVPGNVLQQHNGHEIKAFASAPGVDKPDVNLGKGTARPPGTSSMPSCRPPWVTDTDFAERYHPDKTSTVMTQHSQLAQPTPMQNRSSIVQAAQQAPGDPGRTPVCAHCNKIIRGRYLVALGRSWHPEEFTCCQCKAVLEEGGFFEERGSIYCTKCYDSRYAPNCAKCKKIITGEIMHALKMTWHVQCFVCAACKTPIRNDAFYMEEGEPYCEKDYEKMFGTKCHGCDFKIDAGDRFLEALDYSWHDTCFVCAVCQINLEGKTFYSKKDKPLCKTHAFYHV